MASDGVACLFERERVLAAGAELLDNLAQGRGGALFLVGEPGAGKTAALERICALARAGQRLARARGEAMESALPLAFLMQALDCLQARQVLADGAELGPTRLHYRLLDWLAVSPQPVVLGLDDLHWADPESIGVLAFTCRRLASLPVAVVATLREWPTSAAQMVHGLRHAGHAVVEQLGPLSLESSGRLLARRTSRPVPADLAARAWALCSGNPLLLEQVAVAVNRGERIPQPPAHMPDLGQALVLSRFAGLSEIALRCAQAASVLGAGFTTERVCDMVLAEEAEVDLALETLAQAGLIRGGQDHGLQFAQPLLGQAVYADLSPWLRLRMHARAFSSLQRAGRDAEAAQHALRGDLVGNAEAVAVLEMIGQAALRRGAFGTAATHLRGAVRLAEGHSCVETRLALAEALVGTGAAADAGEVLEGVLGEPDLLTASRVSALRLLGRSLVVTGAARRASDVFAQALSLAQGVDARGAVAFDAALSTWTTVGPGQARALLNDGAAQPLAPVARGVLAFVARGVLAFVAGEAHQVEATVDPAGGAAAGLAGWDAVRAQALALTWAEQFEPAEGLFRSALERATQTEATWAAAGLASGLADLLARLGRLDEALSLLDSAGLPAPIEAYLLLHADRSGAALQRARVAAETHGDDMALLRLLAVEAEYLLHEGHPLQASEVCQQVEVRARELGVEEPCVVRWANTAVRAHVAAGRTEAAERVLGWLRRWTAHGQCIWPRSVEQVGRALLAERQRDHAAAEAHFASALELLRGTPLEVDRVDTQIEYARFLRRAGRTLRARRVSGEALESAQTSGLRWLARLARAELAVLEGRRRRSPAHAARLTTQEGRVAALTAAGFSNREIAQRLCVSESTIETHLLRVYGKLRIHSRRQLIAHPDRLSDA